MRQREADLRVLRAQTPTPQAQHIRQAPSLVEMLKSPRGHSSPCPLMPCFWKSTEHGPTLSFLGAILSVIEETKLYFVLTPVQSLPLMDSGVNICSAQNKKGAPGSARHTRFGVRPTPLTAGRIRGDSRGGMAAGQ